MNLVLLKKLLDEKGIDPGLYDLQYDSDSVYRIAENTEKGYWEVYFFERGSRYSERRFFKEDEAVRYFYDKVAWRQELMNDVRMRLERRSPETQLFLNLYLATEYSVNEAMQIENKTGDAGSTRAIIIKKPLLGTTRVIEITKNLSWEKHISNTKKPSELGYADRKILAMKLMIAYKKANRLPIDGEELIEVAKQIDDRTLLEEANRLFDEL